MTDGPNTKKRAPSTKGNVISVNIEVPEPGQTVTIEVARYNLTLLVERGAAETQEQMRNRFAVVGPTSQGDRRLHAARIGTGPSRGKRISVTLCTETKAVDKANASGARIDVPLDVVTCQGCIRVLTEDGIELKGSSE